MDTLDDTTTYPVPRPRCLSRGQESAYNRLLELNGTVMDDRWLTISDV